MDVRLARKHPVLGQISVSLAINRGSLEINGCHLQLQDGAYTLTIRVRSDHWKIHSIEHWRRGVKTIFPTLEDLPAEDRPLLEGLQQWLNSKECRDRIRNKLMAEKNNLAKAIETLK